MKTPPILQLAIVRLIFLLPGLLVAGEKNYLPVAPSELLSLLPRAPEGWKLTASMGANYPGSQPILTTIVKRVYNFTPPPPLPGEPAPPERITEVTLLDTAYEREKFQYIEGPQNKDSSGKSSDVKRYAIDAAPVVERDQGATRTFMAGFNPRFILIAKFTNQDDSEVKGWLRLLDFPAVLAAAERAPKVPLPSRMLAISYVDELNPKKNTTTQMSYQTDEERLAGVEAFFKTHQPPPPPPSPAPRVK